MVLSRPAKPAVPEPLCDAAHIEEVVARETPSDDSQTAGRDTPRRDRPVRVRFAGRFAGPLNSAGKGEPGLCRSGAAHKVQY
jgi:hypothetical protein